MTTGEPAPSFEVYPPAAEAAGQPEPDPAQTAWEQPDMASAAERFAVTPYSPPPIPPPTTGPSRRGVVGLIVGVPVALVWLGSLNNSTTMTPYQWEEETGGGTWPDSPETDVLAMSIGDESFEVPDGWEVTQVSDVEAVATNGANRVQAYGFAADAADRAVDLIAPLVKRRLGAFKGTLEEPVDESVDDLQQATIRGSGKLSGKAARLVGTLWIDADGAARLAVKVVSAKKGSDIAQEAQDIVDLVSLP